MTNFLHLKALLKKNWILWKRNWFCSLMEIFLPVILLILLFFIRNLVEIKKIAKKDYYNDLYKMSPYRSDEFKNYLKSCDFTGNQKTKVNSIIAISPDTDLTRELAKNFNGTNIRFYKSRDEILNLINEEAYGTDPVNHPSLCFGIIFNKYENGEYSYNIMFNTTGSKEIYDTRPRYERIVPLVQEDVKDFEYYVYNGFLSIQTWIDNLILKRESEMLNTTILPSIQSITVPEYLEDKFPDVMKNSSNTYIVLPMILLFLRIIFRLLYEKERKIREGMKMMGMDNVSFYLSWIITYVIVLTITSIIQTLMLKASIFKHSNGFIIWLYMWLFSLALLAQALFLSVFFTRAKSGLVAGFVFYFMLFIVNALVGTKDVEESVKNAASLSSHAAMSFAADTMLLFESQQQGITFSTISIVLNNYKFSTCLGMCTLNIVVFLIFFLYLDQVFPNEFGKKKHPLFFLMCLRRNRSANPRNDEYELKENSVENLGNDEDDLDKSIVEQVDQNLKQLEGIKQCVSIKKLNKVYPNGKKAVNDLSLTMYNSQIFALLGHNGAGKTTTISMLTGLIEISDGSVNVFEYDVETQIDLIRQFLGVCPQHDILFDDLTVKEHLELFATFKGLKSGEVSQAVDKIIQDLDFLEKKDYLSKNLSGGQKRKLSVGIAFIGGSKFILLDEPTSGMDTSARRHIWEMLKNYKNDRIVVLTTHFMDEADFLGDRIAIMGNGELKCCGSSVFLKNNFGVGYNLTIVKLNTERNPNIENFVKTMVPEATLLSDVSAEVAFQLPISSAPKFKDLFDGLDSRLKDFNIQTYGISITTLEEVFLKIAEGDSLKRRKTTMNKERLNTENDKEVDDFDLNTVRVQSRFKLFFVHFWALIIKKANYFKRDKKGLACEILMPIIMITIGLLLMTISFITDPPILQLTTKLYPTPLEVVWATNTDIAASRELFSNFGNDFKFTEKNFSSIKELNDYVFQHSAQNQRGTLLINNINKTNGSLSYSVLVNTTSPDIGAILYNEINKAFIKMQTGKEISIKIYNDPMPLTKQTKEFESTADGFIGSVIFAIGLSFIPASLIVFIIKEKQYNSKHQQMVSGVGLFAYWSSNFCFDLVKYLIPGIYSALMCKAFDIKSLVEDDCWGACWLLFIFYGFSVISFSYVISFLFKEYGTGQLISFFLNLILGAILNIVIWVLRIIPSSRNSAKIIHFILRFFPSFTFGYGILNISNRQLYALSEGYIKKKNALDLDIAGWDVIYLVLSSVFYFLLIFIIEKLITIPSLLRIFTNENSIKYVPKKYDNDVQREIELIENDSPSNYTVMVKNIRKVFNLSRNKNKIAVDRISFGVKNGECFGLLGINGAGKTTTFKMLSGEIPPTEGNAFIVGKDIVSNLEETRNHIGYCPQFDALLENLTAKEHLYLYAALKGIPFELRKNLIEKKLDEMDLRKFENVVASTYSGGNKRKLSVAIAMLGNPPIVFLDEPSTGMDPHARRFMWNVISRISSLRKRSSVILTTHSMEEAEALSTKMGIMVNGELKCLGSVQHIKNKFGKGYEVEVKTIVPPNSEVNQILSQLNIMRGTKFVFSELENLLTRLGALPMRGEIKEHGSGSSIYIGMNKPEGLAIEILLEYILIERYGMVISEFVERNFGNFTVIEHFQTFFRLKLNTNVSIGKVFGSFEDYKNDLKIAQYSVKQATIEQIFNMFATGQIQDQEDEDETMKQLERRASSIRHVANDNERLVEFPNNQKRVPYKNEVIFEEEEYIPSEERIITIN